MSLVDVDTWLTEFDACERLSNDIQTQITQRKAQSPTSAEYARLSGAVRLRLKQFDNELAQLSHKIRSGQLTRAEAERRRRQIETLQSKLIHLQTQFADDNEEHNRKLLFQKSAPSLWEHDDDDDDDVPFNAALPHSQRHFGAVAPAAGSLNHVDVDDLRRQQERMLVEQDDGLDALAKIISRQKHLALRIGDEVDEQNDILESLAEDVERVDIGIGNETRHVRTVSALESSTCGYWVVIICLFVAIVVVALL